MRKETARKGEKTKGAGKSGGGRRSHRVSVRDKDVYQFLLSDLRYSFPRDNFSAPDSCISHVKEYLPRLGDDFRQSTAIQLMNETIGFLRQGQWEARGHKATIDRLVTVIHEDDSVTTEMFPCRTYITDFKYQEYLKDKEHYAPKDYEVDISKCKVDEGLSYECEDDWLKMLAFLDKYASEGDPSGFVSYNDDGEWRARYKVFEKDFGGGK